MKRNLVVALMIGVALCCGLPAMAQRPSGGHGGGHSSGTSVSRGGGGGHSTGSSVGRSSSSSHSSGMNRSATSPSVNRSTSPSRSSSSTYRTPSTPAGSSRGASRSSSTPSRSYATPGSIVGRTPSAPSRNGNMGTNGRIASTPDRSTHHAATRTPSRVSGTLDRPVTTPDGRGGTGNTGRVSGNGSRVTGGTPGNRGGGQPGDRGPDRGGYATPGHPGRPMPPADRPIHPAPFFHHPHDHHIMHMHLCIWDPIPWTPVYWPGFWYYCNSYWYDYRPTNTVIVREYVSNTYNADLVDYAMSNDYVYALFRDGRDNLIQVFDKSDNLLAQQKVSSKYIKMEVDRENGGCWLFKKRDKDPLLFLYVDNQLLIYESDK